MADLGAIGKNISKWMPGPVPAWILYDYRPLVGRAVPDDWPRFGHGGTTGGGISIF